MTRFLLAINIALAIVAAKLSLEAQRTKVDASVEWPLAPDPPTNADEIAAMAGAAGPVPKKEASMIPEFNLFDPMRRLPDPDAIPVEEVEETTQENIDNHFELVSVGRLGRMACANIMAKTTITPPSRTSTRGQPPKAIADRLRARTAARTPTTKSSSDGKAKVYKVGDSIGESGYRLLRISLRSVVLRSKDDTIVLTMNKSDETSKKRREVAAAAITKKKTDAEKSRLAAARANELNKVKAAAAAKRAGAGKPPATAKKPETEKTATPPPPPPPPPPPLSTPSSPVRSSGVRSTGSTNKRASKIVQPRGSN
jgi:hypothetical protein